MTTPSPGPLRRTKGAFGLYAAVAALVALTAACDDGTGSAPLPTRTSASTAPSGPSVAPTGPEATEVPAGGGGGDARCPGSGVRVTTGPVSAAMGVRGMGVFLVNCGTEPFGVSGYPVLEVLDEEREKLDVAVRLGAHVDGGARRSAFVLRPGERAEASVIWRNTVTRTDVVATSGAYLRVTPAPGVAAQTVAPDDGPLDLGNTGAVEVTPWARPRD
ncbi:DUF4232 domain-containing protein [Streptomyces sp. NRRL S-118]|uniref:DUF4232 domain-containing protein n=1 Tax=Streptomyces sp. NRRL S-118 TaxID=1463881 RepID=UPI0018FF0314|nr:DUF4232 domain-containing protein [Streptomyces sp. NRRL S-118]